MRATGVWQCTKCKKCRRCGRKEVAADAADAADAANAQDAEAQFLAHSRQAPRHLPCVRSQEIGASARRRELLPSRASIHSIRAQKSTKDENPEVGAVRTVGKQGRHGPRADLPEDPNLIGSSGRSDEKDDEMRAEQRPGCSPFWKTPRDWRSVRCVWGSDAPQPAPLSADLGTWSQCLALRNFGRVTAFGSGLDDKG